MPCYLQLIQSEFCITKMLRISYFNLSLIISLYICNMLLIMFNLFTLLINDSKKLL